jgi:serine/threonine-protein kinase
MENKDYDGICRKCGYIFEKQETEYLAPGTMLNERYLLGKLMTYNGESAVYMGFDSLECKKVTIKEYFPRELCVRDDTERQPIKVNRGSLPLYKTYLSEFIDLNRKMMLSRETLRVQKALDVFSANNTAYVVFEYIEGISFKSYLLKRGEKLGLNEIKELFEPVFRSLSAIHAKGVIHRGISPQTLLVNEKNQLNIIGFDIAADRTDGSLADPQTSEGYSAPELYSATARQGSWTDIYSLCAVLYKALCEIQPVGAPERIKSDTLYEPAFYDMRIPKYVSKAIMRGLSLEPEKRIQTINELDNLLFRQPVAEDVTRDINLSHIHDISASKTKTPVVSQNQNRKNQSFVYTIGILVSVAVIGIIMAVAYPGNRSRPIVGTDNKEPSSEQITIISSSGITDGTNAYTNESLATQSPLITSTNKPVYKIPDFRGRMFEVIEKSPGYSFLVITPEYEFNDENAKGIIIDQNIKVDEEVTSGTEITVKVSKGDGFVKLPDYNGDEITKYKGELKSLGIQFRTAREFSDDVPEGVVTRCASQDGDKIGADITVGETVDIRAGEAIFVLYSKGAKP